MHEMIFSWLYAQLGSSITLKKASFSMGDSQLVKAGREKYLLKFYDAKKKLNNEITGSKFCTSVAGIRAPKIIAFNYELLIALLEHIPGKPLTQILKENSTNPYLQSVVCEVGLTLRKLHKTPIYSYYDKLYQIVLKEQFAHEYSILSEFLRHFEKDKYLYVLLQKVLEALNPLLFKIPQISNNVSFIHADFWSGNILVMNNKCVEIAFIDFEYSGIGNPILDIARIYSRGLNRQDRRKIYSLAPPSDLWQFFKDQYDCVNSGEEISPNFRQVIIYQVVRTINFYVYQIINEVDHQKIQRIRKTILRISSALILAVSGLNKIEH